MTGRRHLTWTRIGVVLSLGLVAFGLVDATLPHLSGPGSAVSGPGTPGRPTAQGTTVREASRRGTGRLSASIQAAAQAVAIRFVVATDTSDPTHPEGNIALRAALAPGLVVPRRLHWPEAWAEAHRTTTPVLDAPGPVVELGTGRVAVVVTGRTVVTTDTGPTTEVPLDEKVTLLLAKPHGQGASPGTSRWVVADVGTGS